MSTYTSSYVSCCIGLFMDIMHKSRYSNGLRVCVFLKGIFKCQFWTVLTALVCWVWKLCDSYLKAFTVTRSKPNRTPINILDSAPHHYHQNTKWGNIFRVWETCRIIEAVLAAHGGPTLYAKDTPDDFQSHQIAALFTLPNLLSCNQESWNHGLHSIWLRLSQITRSHQ